MTSLRNRALFEHINFAQNFVYASSTKDDLLKRHSIFRGSQITNCTSSYFDKVFGKFTVKDHFLPDQSLLDYENHTDFEKLRSVYENFEKCF